MEPFTFALAVLIWGVLPGFVLVSTLRIDWILVERLAAAPGLSLAFVACAAYAAELVGLPVSPLPVLAILTGACIAIGAAARRFPATRPSESLTTAPFSAPRPVWIPWLIFLIPQLIVAQLEPVSTVALLPPSLHDGLDHATWFRLVYETQSLDPHEVLAPPIGDDGTPAYYPWGLHAVLALVAQTTTLDPVAVLMQGLVLISAALPLSVYAFVALFTGRGWPAIAAAAMSLLFWWLPYQVWSWGGYALLAGAIAALPFSRLALTVVDRFTVPGLAACGACAIGVLCIHPSQALAALIITTVVSVTLAASRALRWRTAAPFLAMCGVTALALTAGASAWDPLAAFLDKASAIATTVGDPRYAWPAAVYFDDGMQFPRTLRIILAVLYVIGAGVAGWFTSTRPLLVLHLVFSLLIPAARHQTWLTSLWYHSPERLWYAQQATLPALGALGVAAVVMAVERLIARWRTIALARLVVWPAVLWGLYALLYPSYVTWGSLKLFQHAQRNPNHTITDARILADYRWIEANIARGEVIFNAPADWGLPLPFTGRRTAFWSGGHALDRATPWYSLLEVLGRGDPDASQAAAELRSLGIQYVYAGSLGPTLEVGRQKLDASVLKATTRLQLLYESPTAAIFRIPDEGAVRLGVTDSDRVQFVGFHPPEREGDRQWRWTAGDGRVRLRTAALPAGDCFARIHGPDPRQYYFRIDGDEFALTANGYPIPATYRTGDAIEILIRVPEAVRKIAGTGAAARPIGVRVTNVEVRCGV